MIYIKYIYLLYIKYIHEHMGTYRRGENNDNLRYQKGRNQENYSSENISIGRLFFLYLHRFFHSQTNSGSSR